MVNMRAYIKFGEFCQFVLKVLSGIEILGDWMTDERNDGQPKSNIAP